MQVRDTLSRAGPEVRLLNDPSRVLGRYDLLRVLYDGRENSYRAVRASAPLPSLRYPVLIKQANEHGHALPVLLHDPGELAKALRYLRIRGHRLSELLVVEFCDTSSGTGIFRKYSAFIVGERILPRHLIFSRHWNAKRLGPMDPGQEREQREYLERNPHETWLRRLFKVAGIDYGRIDYGLLGDAPQVWEINTNPTVHRMTPRLTSAFEAIDCAPASDTTFPLRVDPALLRTLQREKTGQSLRLAVERTVDHLFSTRPARRVVRVIRLCLPNPWYPMPRPASDRELGGADTQASVRGVPAP